MLTMHRITRLVEAEQFSPLLDEILANGRPVALPIRIRLDDPQGRAASALGLALARAAEITFALSDSARQMIMRLARLQQPDGAFGSIAATAVAVRGLLTARAQLGAEDLHPLIDGMVGRALSRMMLWQEEDGALGDVIDTTICAWQLGEVRDFQRAIRWGDFLDIATDLPLPNDASTPGQRAA